MTKSNKIDFVITWVDGNDSKWQKEKNNYLGKKDLDLNDETRFRDWGFLRYWFRSVERHAPWVNKIYFITQGHLPEWLNTDAEKLVIVKHSDIIEKEYLPTFSSHPIEWSINKIPNLSDCFVYFNDDTFLNGDVKETDFFMNNLPRDIGVFSPIVPKRYAIASVVLNNVEIINEYFNCRSVLKKNFFKFFRFGYGKHLLKNFCVLPWHNILGFYDAHLPISYNKSTFDLIWKKEEAQIRDTMKNKFRTKEDISPWLVRYWQIASGQFIPRTTRFGQYYSITDNIDGIVTDIKHSKHKLICLNDGVEISDFDKIKSCIHHVFEEKYNKKSVYEL